MWWVEKRVFSVGQCCCPVVGKTLDNGRECGRGKRRAAASDRGRSTRQIIEVHVLEDIKESDRPLLLQPHIEWRRHTSGQVRWESTSLCCSDNVTHRDHGPSNKAQHPHVRESGHRRFNDSLRPPCLFAFWCDSPSCQCSVNQSTWSLWDTQRKSLAIEITLICRTPRLDETTPPPATPVASGSNMYPPSGIPLQPPVKL